LTYAKRDITEIQIDTKTQYGGEEEREKREGDGGGNAIV
jgi:hypothetical protein